MIQRAGRGERLFHPFDAFEEDRPVPLPEGRMVWRPCEGRKGTMSGGEARVF